MKTYKTILKTIQLLNQKLRLNCILGFVLYLGLVGYSLATTAISATLFNRGGQLIEGSIQVKEFLVMVALFCGLRLVQTFLVFFIGINDNVYIYRKGSYYFRLLLGEKAARLPLIDYEDKETLDELARAEEVVDEAKLSDLFVVTLTILKNIGTILGTIIILMQFSPVFLLLAIPSVLPYALTRILRGKQFYKLKYYQTEKQRRYQYYWQLFSNKKEAKEIRVCGAEDYFVDKWKGLQKEINDERLAFERKDLRHFFACNALQTLGYLLSIIFALRLVINQQIELGTFGACIVAFSQVQNNVKELMIYIGFLFELAEFNQNYFAFLDLEEEPVAREKPVFENQIAVKNLTFAYPHMKEAALKNIQLTIRKGERVIIVGENGSGKTTLSKLLLGIYEPSSGQVLYDGKALGDIEKDGFYKKIGVVSQNFSRFEWTLRENISIADRDKHRSEEEMLAILDDLDIDSWRQNELQLDTQLGREFGGRDLSGGQWQKIAIARCLFKKSEMVILDEPTSALDPVIETEILSKFLELSQGKTAIIISHRVGLCRLMDKVVVMRKGQVVEVGTHKALMAQEGYYKMLYEAQKKWYEGD